MPVRTYQCGDYHEFKAPDQGEVMPCRECSRHAMRLSKGARTVADYKKAHERRVAEAKRRAAAA
jgi:hypothetical protein